MTVDVAVLGDGPAGSALAGELCVRGVDVVLIGDDLPWAATYGMWADEVDDVPLEVPTGRAAGVGAASGPAAVATTISPEVRCVGARTHVVARPYLVADNVRLARALRRDAMHRVAHIDRIERSVDASTQWSVIDSAGELPARLVVDCTGGALPGNGRRAHRAPAFQTAFGVVLADPPPAPYDVATVMDFTPPPVIAGGDPAGDAVSFVYALPVADGWLVEETVLAARPEVAPDALAPRLAARLGVRPDVLGEHAVRTERVRFPMTSVLPDRDERAVTFGAAAGFVHPATGYSVAASMRAAGRVAAAIAEACQDGTPGVRLAPIHDAVWPPDLRRSRRLHEFGLEVLLGLDSATTRQFFDAFFELPVDRWAPYMRIDTPPSQLAGIMFELFRSAPLTVQRRLMSPSAVVRAGRLLRHA